ncbi:MAG: GIY-YIG nuclease family protein [Candidatus Omnitrophica bacterium]|nr:GIY-YIG nuclease family protein [Candidatus Omnitrophota bacterium]
MKNKKTYFYILSNKRKSVLYVGSTNDLIKRLQGHRKGYNKGFTQKYNVNRLVCYEIFEHIDKAKDREREVKGWRRQRKIELIEAMNKRWKDLYDEFTRDSSLRSE